MRINLGSTFSYIFITFLVLKLTGQIDWSWWWITSPLWIPFAAMIPLMLAAIFFMED